MSNLKEIGEGLGAYLERLDEEARVLDEVKKGDYVVSGDGRAGYVIDVTGDKVAFDFVSTKTTEHVVLDKSAVVVNPGGAPHVAEELARAAFGYVISEVEESDSEQTIGEALMVGIGGAAKDAGVDQNEAERAMISFLENVLVAAMDAGN
jgi:preprotein translocase subunit YajC